MVTEQRQHCLQQQYSFACCCPSCKQPPAAEQGMVAVKCLACEGPLRLATATSAGLCSFNDLLGGSGRCLRYCTPLPCMPGCCHRSMKMGLGELKQ